MITLAEAQKLKDAKFPLALGSDGQCRGYRGKMYTVNSTGWQYDGPGYSSNTSDYLPAPNSDELIAAIQERWPTTNILRWVIYHKAGSLSEHPGGFVWSIKTDTPKLDRYQSTDPDYASAPTLLSALVDLYCKLAEAK